MKGLEGRDEKEVRLIITGGGTGGHLFPGIAVAKEMSRRCEKGESLFVTGGRRMESDILSRAGYQQTSIAVEGIKGRGWKRGMMVLVKLPWSFLQALMIVRRFSPHIVLGVGGYSAGPVCVAAKVMGIPSAIHEQNSFPGITNRLLCRVVDRVFISFEESAAHFRGGALFLTGNPIRRELLAGGEAQKKESTRFTVLVTGGSQGAHAINETFVEALRILKLTGRDVYAIHQTGEADWNWVADAYRKMELPGEVIPFIQDMAGAYQKADMVVSRAGASTISELAAMGKPSILVPYPYAANNHQETNARMLAERGGAVMVLQKDLTGQGLANLLEKYMDDRASLKDLGELAKSAGKPDADRIIVDHLLDMIRP
jgi:UDP-N-acetylglucosamine--N-acetylmuramyl-(pentapeptide) pyrophosphoryl-undecaprenol N-acetylglucosamine transferase